MNQERSQITLDSDRAGIGAAVLSFAQSCSIGDAVSAPSELAEADRYDHIERLAPGFQAQRFYVFDGGCVWWEFDFDQSASSTESVAVGDALRLIPRAAINEDLRSTFVDREL